MKTNIGISIISLLYIFTIIVLIIIGDIRGLIDVTRNNNNVEIFFSRSSKSNYICSLFLPKGEYNRIYSNVPSLNYLVTFNIREPLNKLLDSFFHN